MYSEVKRKENILTYLFAGYRKSLAEYVRIKVRMIFIENLFRFEFYLIRHCLTCINKFRRSISSRFGCQT